MNYFKLILNYPAEEDFPDGFEVIDRYDSLRELIQDLNERFKLNKAIEKHVELLENGTIRGNFNGNSGLVTFEVYEYKKMI